MNENTKRNKKRDLEGSMTVEASYVTLSLLFFVMFLLMIGIYLHDVCYLYASAQYNANEIARDISHKTKEGSIDWTLWESWEVFSSIEDTFSQKKSELRNRVSEKIGAGLIFPRRVSSMVDLMDQRVVVTYMMQYSFPMGYLMRRVVSALSFQVYVKASSDCLIEEKMVRELQSVFHAVSQEK